MIDIYSGTDYYFNFKGADVLGSVSVQAGGFVMGVARDNVSASRSSMKRYEVVPTVQNFLKQVCCHEPLNCVSLEAGLKRLELYACKHLGRAPDFSYDIDPAHRKVVELAPVVPPEAVERIVKEAPVVREAARLLASFYLFLSTAFYEDAKGKLNEGVLDRYLEDAWAVLTEVGGRQQRLHDR